VTLALRFAARSHAGLLRTMNEDSVYAGPRLLAVADGMGGHAAGEVASAVAIASLAPLDEDAPGADLLAALKEAADSANAHLRDMVLADSALRGMGTTLVALLFSGGRLGLLHVGDSRCYLLRDGELTQITHDHTLVQQLIDDGRITEEDASTHPQRSVITRVLDGRGDVELDLSVRAARAGDRYLVCSDGLTGPVGSNETLREALSMPDPQDAVDRLVQLALRGGGPDNVTVIVADVVDEDVPVTPPVVAGAAAEAPQEAPPGIADSPASPRRTGTAARPPPYRADPARGSRGARRKRRRRMGVRPHAVLRRPRRERRRSVPRRPRRPGRGVVPQRRDAHRAVEGRPVGGRAVPARGRHHRRQRTRRPRDRAAPHHQYRVRRHPDSHPFRLGARRETHDEAQHDARPPSVDAPAHGLPDPDCHRRVLPVTAPAVPAPARPGRTRRGTELFLLAFATALAGLGYAAVSLAKDGSVPTSALGYGAGLATLYGLAHLAVRRLAPYADPLILPCVALLNGLGIVLVHRLDVAAAESARQAGRAVPGGDAPLQLVWTTIGVVGFVAVLHVVRDHTRLARYTYTSAVAGLVLLLLPAIPGVGATINGARLWIRLGPITVQPSEVAKILLMVFFAGYLVAKRDVLSLASRRVLGVDFPRARDLGPVLLAWAASIAVLVREKDLGSSLLFFGIFVVMLYVATERTSWLLIGVTLFGASSYAAYHLFDHVAKRVDTWLDPFAYTSGNGYQLVQGLFGMGTGGIFGTGLGEGSPGTVPFAKTDFILAAVGEELGLVGVMAVLMLFALIVERGLRTALSCRDSFGKLLAGGLSFALGLQVFVIAGGVIGLIPLTGVTLPWLSYGGSSVVSNYLLIALLLRISDAARRPAPAPVSPATARATLQEAKTTVVRR
jgi:cell division protein FtsW (lipid II flippase)/serine/threonine protein phosphatase PrpC